VTLAEVCVLLSAILVQICHALLVKNIIIRLHKTEYYYLPFVKILFSSQISISEDYIYGIIRKNVKHIN